MTKHTTSQSHTQHTHKHINSQTHTHILVYIYAEIETVAPIAEAESIKHQNELLLVEARKGRAYV